MCQAFRSTQAEGAQYQFPNHPEDTGLKVEEKHLDEGLALSSEQIARIEHYNPCFKERHVESFRPGELLSADTFFVGSLKEIGKLYLHAVVDTYGSYAFGFLHTGKKPEYAATLLHNDVLPFYQNHQLDVSAILTDNGPEFCGTPNHPFELYLSLNDIKHCRIKVRTPSTNGFVERFNRTFLDEFFCVFVLFLPYHHRYNYLVSLVFHVRVPPFLCSFLL